MKKARRLQEVNRFGAPRIFLARKIELWFPGGSVGMKGLLKGSGNRKSNTENYSFLLPTREGSSLVEFLEAHTSQGVNTLHTAHFDQLPAAAHLRPLRATCLTSKHPQAAVLGVHDISG